MQVHIKDMNGHELKIRHPYGMKFGLQVEIKLNDGSDPTEIELTFDAETAKSLGNAIAFFT